MPAAFDFGANWKAYSKHKLDGARFEAAAGSLDRLVGSGGLRDKSFLDVGCGSGIMSVAAARQGAFPVLGFDISGKSIQACNENLLRLNGYLDGYVRPRFITGSILDRNFTGDLGFFDIVYSWGVLHHTDHLWAAIERTASLVNPNGGLMILAIYNRHWSSPLWRSIKHFYNMAHYPVRRLMAVFFAGIIYLARYALTRENPLKKERGMDFWYDVIDWIGGYPYEYASVNEVTGYLEKSGFNCVNLFPSRVPTGCNEFVFERTSQPNGREG